MDVVLKRLMFEGPLIVDYSRILSSLMIRVIHKETKRKNQWREFIRSTCTPVYIIFFAGEMVNDFLGILDVNSLLPIFIWH
jgi:hypothetical protein